MTLAAGEIAAPPSSSARRLLLPQDGGLVSYENRAQALTMVRTRGPYERYFKPVLDRTVGLALLVLLLPVLAAAALISRVRFGRPVFHRELRVGKNGKVFRLTLLRTSRQLEWPPSPRGSGVPPPRASTGRWRLDELPKLFNVVLGQMSLVGPCPERPSAVDKYEPWEHRRHQVKPGVIGPWRLVSRGAAEPKPRSTAADLAYVDSLSFLNDARVVATIIAALTGRTIWRADGDDIEVGSLPRRTWDEIVYLAMKRVVDITVSAVLLIALSPLLLGVAVAIKLDSPGPVLFRQVRVGFHGHLFRIVKFRTMVDTASDGPHRAHHEALSAGQSPGKLRLVDDDRVTRLGRSLRAWSIDELPNLWNVLRGEMSLVGPRPLVPFEADLHRSDDRRRLDAKPGVSGMAQVRGRGDISPHDRMAYDEAYVNNRSMWVDTKILAHTAIAVIATRGD